MTFREEAKAAVDAMIEEGLLGKDADNNIFFTEAGWKMAYRSYLSELGLSDVAVTTLMDRLEAGEPPSVRDFQEFQVRTKLEGSKS